MEAAWNIPRTLAAATHDHGGDCPLAARPTLVFDCDGVLAFTAEALCTALNSRFGTTYSPLSQAFFPGTLVTSRLPAEQAAWVSGLLRERSFLGTLAPDAHAFDALRGACEAGFGCLVATERDPSAQDATAGWLADWGAPPVPVHAVGHGNKPAFLAGLYGEDDPAVLIDDNPTAQVTIARPGIEVWAPDRNYVPDITRPFVRRFTTWQQVRYWLSLSPQP